MIVFLIGLFIGAIIGFVYAAVISSGKKADAYVYRRLMQVEKKARIGTLGPEGMAIGS